MGLGKKEGGLGEGCFPRKSLDAQKNGRKTWKPRAKKRGGAGEEKAERIKWGGIRGKRKARIFVRPSLLGCLWGQSNQENTDRGKPPKDAEKDTPLKGPLRRIIPFKLGGNHNKV